MGGYLNMLNMKTFLVTVANVEYYVSTVDLGLDLQHVTHIKMIYSIAQRGAEEIRSVDINIKRFSKKRLYRKKIILFFSPFLILIRASE